MHVPVLKKEVIEYLNPKGKENFIDATLGFAGHTKEILKETRGKVLGIEISKELSEKIKREGIERLEVVNSSYSNLRKIVKQRDFSPVNGVLFDLGFSSWHIEKSLCGFSFQRDEFLDMRFSKENHLTAYEIVNYWKAEDIEEVLREYGEERFSRKIVKKIIEQRKKEKIKTTFQLRNVIESVVHKRGKIHPATRTFQGLRIKVNDELNVLKRGLLESVDVIDQGGRIVVISFHSLEDRIVKDFFKDRDDLRVLTKRPVIAKEEEIKNNPRSRSAKLRACIKI